MKEIIDLSNLNTKDKQIVEKVIAILKENETLRNILKDITKLI